MSCASPDLPPAGLVSALVLALSPTALTSAALASEGHLPIVAIVSATWYLGLDIGEGGRWV